MSEVTCDHCGGGTGVIGFYADVSTCPRCNSTGKIPEEALKDIVKRFPAKPHAKDNRFSISGESSANSSTESLGRKDVPRGGGLGAQPPVTLDKTSSGVGVPPVRKYSVPQCHQTNYLYVISQFQLDQLAHDVARHSQDKWKVLSAGMSFNAFVREYVEEPTPDHIATLLDQTEDQLPELDQAHKDVLREIGPSPLTELRSLRAQLEEKEKEIAQLRESKTIVLGYLDERKMFTEAAEKWQQERTHLRTALEAAKGALELAEPLLPVAGLARRKANEALAQISEVL